MSKLKSTSIKQVAIIQKISTRVAIIGSIISFPYITFATSTTLATLATSIADYMNKALNLMMGFAVVAFVYYVIKYFITANDKRSEAGQYIMYSMIGFFVILSMWGIVNILVNTFELDSNSPSSWSDIKQLFPTDKSNPTSGSVKAETSAFDQAPNVAGSSSQ